jgi:hypothetical protein
MSNVENVYEQFGNVSNVDVIQLANVKAQATIQKTSHLDVYRLGIFCHQ